MMHTAQARAEVRPLSVSGRAEPEDRAELTGCEAAVAAGSDVIDKPRGKWEATLQAAKVIRAFGKHADQALKRALDEFDRTAEEEEATCVMQRRAFETKSKEMIWAYVTEQRNVIQRSVADDLTNRLLDDMERRGGPLRVQEKMVLLESATKRYRSLVDSSLPEWAAGKRGLGQKEAELAFGEVQFGIESSGEGLGLRQMWQDRDANKLASTRAHGVSLSLEPALRIMVRPEGFGNFQVFSAGPVGPPNRPATVNVGILNDGSIADMYREHPVPPKFAVQPAVNFNLNIG